MFSRSEDNVKPIKLHWRDIHFDGVALKLTHFFTAAAAVKYLYKVTISCTLKSFMISILSGFRAHRSFSKVILRNDHIPAWQVMVHSPIKNWRLLIARKTPTHWLRLTYTWTPDHPSSLVETAYAQARGLLITRMMTMMMMMMMTTTMDNGAMFLLQLYSFSIVNDSATIRSQRQQVTINF